MRRFKGKSGDGLTLKLCAGEAGAKAGESPVGRIRTAPRLPAEDGRSLVFSSDDDFVSTTLAA